MSKIDELIKEKCPNGVVCKPLGEVCHFIRGKGMSKSDKGSGDTNIILYGELYTVYGNYITEIVSRADFEKAKKSTLLQKNDIVIPISSTTKEAQIGKASALCVDEPVYLGGDALCLRHEQIPGFLVHLLNSSWFEQHKMKYVRGTTIMHLSPDGIAKIKIPVPPIEVQQEIVKTLDNFTELEAELEAELTKRKQQYEYYRDHLLSFENIAGEGGQVEWLSLEELLSYKQPGKYIVKSTNYDDSFSTPVLTAGQSFVLGYTDETNGIYSATQEKPVIIFDDFTTSFHWVDFDFKVKSSAMKILSLKNSENNFRYIFYAMQCIKYTPGQHSRQWIGKYSKIKIPIPPKNIQERIVYVLDNFDAVCHDLNIGLPAEINARQKQYEYYRDRLLSFNAVSGNGIERERGLAKLRQYVFGYAVVKLGDIAELERGGSFQKKDFVKSGIPCIHYGQIYTKFGTLVKEPLTYISENIARKQKIAHENDLVMAVTSENIEDVCKTIVWQNIENVAISGHAVIIRSSENTKFLAYFFQTANFFSQKRKIAHGTKVIEIAPKDLKNILICLPNLEKQNEIANKIEIFETLTSSITSGLPAEINARQKQYEYYRDKLLTFKTVQ